MAISLLDKLSSLPLVFLDVETTGSSTAYGDRVTEIALLRVEDGQYTDRFAQLVNPGRPVWANVTALTGITNEMLADQPTFEEIVPEIHARLDGAIVIGHNVRFDLAFVDAELCRCGKTVHHCIDTPKVLDTVRLARRIYGKGGNGLQKLAARLEVTVDTAHRALADCITTAAVFERMLEPLGGGQMQLCDVIRLQGGICKFQSPTLKPIPHIRPIHAVL